MSTGTRFHNFREGDRSEYLAVYLLSRLGLVTQVPRQEDIGFGAWIRRSIVEAKKSLF